MTVIGNILWLVLAGWWLAIAYVAAGVVNLLPIITIPLAIQSFKLAGYALWPFGRVVIDIPNRSGGLSFIANVIWFFLGGVWLALGHIVAGVLLMITIIGIPLGVASFKMAGLALAPFGRTVVDERLARPEQVVVATHQLGQADHRE